MVSCNSSPVQKFYGAKTWLFLRIQHIVRKAYITAALCQEKMNETDTNFILF